VQLEELKRDGFVVIDGVFDVVGLLPEGAEPPADGEDTLERIIEE
jgi:hypothetical protein